jgi:hypothetical protein
MTCPAAIIRRYKTCEQVRGCLASRGSLSNLEGWRTWIARFSRDDGAFWVEVWLPTEKTLRSSERAS